MTHALARRRGNPSNKSDHRLSHIVSYPFSAGFLIGTTNFAAHDNTIRIGIVVEHLHDINML